MWAEGRLKLEPWLAARINHDEVKLFPNSQVTTCKELAGGALEVELSTGEVITIDQVILATGYKVDVGKIPMLATGQHFSETRSQERLSRAGRAFSEQHSGPVLHEHVCDAGLRAVLRFHRFGARIGNADRRSSYPKSKVPIIE